MIPRVSLKRERRAFLRMTIGGGALICGAASLIETE